MIKVTLNIGSRIILKSIATYLFISILIAILLIYKNPSHGYELSIYSSLPVVAAHGQCFLRLLLEELGL